MALPRRPRSAVVAVVTFGASLLALALWPATAPARTVSPPSSAPMTVELPAPAPPTPSEAAGMLEEAAPPTPPPRARSARPAASRAPAPPSRVDPMPRATDAPDPAPASPVADAAPVAPATLDLTGQVLVHALSGGDHPPTLGGPSGDGAPSDGAGDLGAPGGSGATGGSSAGGAGRVRAARFRFARGACVLPPPAEHLDPVPAVLVEVATDARGEITSARALRDPGFGLGEAAVTCVRNGGAAEPARDPAGRPIAHVQVLRMRFSRR